MVTSRPALFPSHGDAPPKFGDSFGGSRVYDYTMKYPPEKPGEEHKENSRVWNVFLDESESHNRDMLQGFRDIIDGVLVFASLFSAVVTTVVAQTSQVLQPDNAQIMVSILVETNQLLRAAGNVTTINAVPKSTLSPGSVSYASTDVLVNALFFTSLGLSLSTALLTVLVKQWLHAYSSFVTGDARRRALITDFRSEGLRIWRVRQIIEALPLILHGSVLIFFVGLILYASQLSTSICVIIATITALTFTFYVGSSFLPLFFVGCPYRIPFLFEVGQTLLLSIYSIAVAASSIILLARNLLPSRIYFACFEQRVRWQNKTYRRSLEGDESLGTAYSPNTVLNILERLYETTSQKSAQEVVVQAVFSLLLGMEDPIERRGVPTPASEVPLHHALLWQTFRYSLNKYVDPKEFIDDHHGSRSENIRTWEDRIAFLLENHIQHGHERLSALFYTFQRADYWGNDHACDRILDWIGKPALEDSSNAVELLDTLQHCSGDGVRQLLKRAPAMLSIRSRTNESALHRTVWYGTLDAVKAIVEADQSSELLNSISTGGQTPLDFAFEGGRLDIVNYLMDHGARAQSSSYEARFLSGIMFSNWPVVKLLWSRRRLVSVFDTRPDSWWTKSATEIANDMLPSWMDEAFRQKVVKILQECDAPL